MNFLEQHDGGIFSAEQLALAEAEIEEKRLEWEKNRLEALRLEQMELDKQNQIEESNILENDLTYPRDDSLNQVNVTVNSETKVRLRKKRLKKRSVVENESCSDIKPVNDLKMINSSDMSSPRTRSTGKIPLNLWTLDVSPILPGAKKPLRNGPASNNKKHKFNNKHSVSNSCSDSNCSFEDPFDKSDSIVKTNSVVLDSINSELTISASGSNYLNKDDDSVTDLGINNLSKTSSNSNHDDSGSSVQDNSYLSNNGTDKKSSLKRRRKWAIVPSNNRTLDGWLFKTPRNFTNDNSIGKAKSKKFLKRASNDVLIKRKTRQSVSMSR